MFEELKNTFNIKKTCLKNKVSIWLKKKNLKIKGFKKPKNYQNTLLIEGGSLISILAINNKNFFTKWIIAPIITKIQLKLQHF